MATISKVGIVNGQAIDAQQILNIIEALDGNAAGITIIATGSFTGSFTGSLLGTASYITSSNVYGPYNANSVISASHAVTASYTLNGGITKADLFQHLNPTISSLGGTYAPTINAQRETFVTLNGISSSFTINNPITGSTPMEGDKLVFRLFDNGTLRNLTWGTAYVQRGAAIPSTTNTINKISTTTFLFNTSASVWDSVGYVIGY